MFLTLVGSLVEQLADHAGQRADQGGLARSAASRRGGGKAVPAGPPGRRPADRGQRAGTGRHAADRGPAQAAPGNGDWSITRTSSPSTAATRRARPSWSPCKSRLKKMLDDLIGPGGRGPAHPACRSPRPGRPGAERRPAGAKIDALAEISPSGGWIRCATSASCRRPTADRGSWNWPGPTIARCGHADAAQLQRLEQITLQLHGPMAFANPEIVARLGLTDEQRQTIRQIDGRPLHRRGIAARSPTARTAAGRRPARGDARRHGKGAGGADARSSWPSGGSSRAWPVQGGLRFSAARFSACWSAARWPAGKRPPASWSAAG